MCVYVNTYKWYTIPKKEAKKMNKSKFTTTIDTELLEQIKIQAIKEKCSVSSLLERLIARYIKELASNDDK